MSTLAVSDKQTYVVKKCPICSNTRLHYVFSVGSYRVVRCSECGLLMLNPQPSDEELGAIYGAHYFLGEGSDAERMHVATLKRATAANYLDLLSRYRGCQGGRLLEVGSGHGDFLVVAAQRGFDVTGVEYSSHACDVARATLNGTGTVLCGEVEDVFDQNTAFDVCVLSDVIEHVRDPRRFLERIHDLLEPGGVIFIATPNTRSWSARFQRNHWVEFKPEHLFYFHEANLQGLLFHCDFGQIVIKPGVKSLSLDYIAGHFARYPVPMLSSLVTIARSIMPLSIRHGIFRTVPSGMILMARAQERRSRRRLSIVVPAFNEAATFEPIMEKLSAKQLDGVDIEIIVVESNSTDGTREIALRYRDRPRFTLVLEDRPKGKGHAVRTGLQHASGDFILIQDADLEYDIEDYEALLEPLFSGKEAFVLGSRHGGRTLKIRRFEGDPFSTLLLNCGHWIFTGLIDVLYGLTLKDPFTMYKVFRRDCLYGLSFECNRFDFDFELLIKLVRKGYRPVEIPVNYNARSFKHGKKVSIFRDPLTWIRALVKYRVVKIDPLENVK